MADKAPNPKHRCMLAPTFRNMRTNPASLICKDWSTRNILGTKIS